MLEPYISTWEVLLKKGQQNKKLIVNPSNFYVRDFLPVIWGCKLPFRHFSFPQDPVSRAKCTEFVNRKDSPNDSTVREPREQSVICSDHFVGGEPTPSNPYPTLKMGYNIVSLHGELSLRRLRLKLRAVNPLEITLKKRGRDPNFCELSTNGQYNRSYFTSRTHAAKVSFC